MDQASCHAKRVCDGTSMLRACTTKDGQAVFGNIIPALHTDLFDCVCHVFNGNAKEPVRNVFRCAPDLFGHFFKSLPCGGDVERLIGIWSKNGREELGAELANHGVGIRYSQHTTAAIANRAGVGAGAFGANLHTVVVISQKAATPGCHRVDIHHRGGDPHAGNFGIQHPFVFARIVANIAGCAAHIKTDDLLFARHLAGAHAANNPAGRAGKNGIFALKGLRIRQPAGALHKHQFAGCIAIKSSRNTIDITA